MIDVIPPKIKPVDFKHWGPRLSRDEKLSIYELAAICCGVDPNTLQGHRYEGMTAIMGAMESAIDRGKLNGKPVARERFIDIPRNTPTTWKSGSAMNFIQENFQRHRLPDQTIYVSYPSEAFPWARDNGHPVPDEVWEYVKAAEVEQGTTAQNDDWNVFYFRDTGRRSLDVWFRRGDSEWEITSVDNLGFRQSKGKRNNAQVTAFFKFIRGDGRVATSDIKPYIVSRLRKTLQGHFQIQSDPIVTEGGDYVAQFTVEPQAKNKRVNTKTLSNPKVLMESEKTIANDFHRQRASERR